MTGDAPRFLPDRLRPPTPGRRSRRGLVLLSVVPFMLLAAPMWRVESVRVDGCPKLPQSAVASLESLVGQPAIGLDVRAIRERVEVWPGVGDVRVDFLLPGTVTVRAETAEVLASVRVGRSWHGVDSSGNYAGRLSEPVHPVFEGFESVADRRRGLDVARRVGGAAGVEVLSVQRITPGDYRLQLESDRGADVVTIHVRPQGTSAEAVWCASFAKGSVGAPWADLRRAERIVIGGGA